MMKRKRDFIRSKMCCSIMGCNRFAFHKTQNRFGVGRYLCTPCYTAFEKGRRSVLAVEYHKKKKNDKTS